MQLDLPTRAVTIGPVQVFVDDLLQVSRVKSKNIQLLFSDDRVWPPFR